MNSFYKQGVDEALQHLGLKQATLAHKPTDTPFPTKSPTIPAERLAAILQQQDDDIDLISPENGRAGKGKHTTWSHPINLSNLDEGYPMMSGVMTPVSPRG